MPSPPSKPATDAAPSVDASDLSRLLAGTHNDPFSVLGLHLDADGRWVVRCLQPQASRVGVIDREGRTRGELTALAPGFFCGRVHAPQGAFAYRLAVSGPGMTGVRIIDDPYRFGPVLGELDQHLLVQGRHWRAWQVMGAQARTVEGVAGTAFALWAPHAQRVSVVGEFNRWDGRIHPMRCRREAGVWEIFLPGVGHGDYYKFEILDAQGQLRLKADPFARWTEQPPATASRVRHDTGYVWRDQAWLDRRRQHNARHAPLSIYEVHLGSWQQHPDGSPWTLAELTEPLLNHVKSMGFTHLELLPVFEHPFGGSWGYQPTALYAPSARWGDPDDLKRFIDRAHAMGLGVILDWVPAHFPTDEHGLGRFDGTALYEHEDPQLGMHADWGTLIYNFGRFEVANYLIANALYWLKEFHVDGLRVDAVASMLYLDYSRAPGTWRPNIHGGNQNLEAVAFLRLLNERIGEECPGTLTFAEESTSWPGVSRPTWLGGLGFDFKWNLGWMNDTLGYMARDPIHRPWHQHQLTFGLLYAFSEQFVLPLSHDEVVHGKGSLLTRMPGDDWQRFANLRLYLSFMWLQPGKKLLFMGGEFGQRREWNHDAPLDWFLLDDPHTGAFHGGVQTLVQDLNGLYRSHGALHRFDGEPRGFEWIDCEDSTHSVLVWLRLGDTPDDCLMVICNFTPVVRHDYRVGLPMPGRWQELLNTDARTYGGSGAGNLGSADAEPVPWHGRPNSVALCLPPLAALVLRPVDAGIAGLPADPFRRDAE